MVRSMPLPPFASFPVSFIHLIHIRIELQDCAQGDEVLPIWSHWVWGFIPHPATVWTKAEHWSAAEEGGDSTNPIALGLNDCSPFDGTDPQTKKKGGRRSVSPFNCYLGNFFDCIPFIHFLASLDQMLKGGLLPSHFTIYATMWKQTFWFSFFAFFYCSTCFVDWTLDYVGTEHPWCICGHHFWYNIGIRAPGWKWSMWQAMIQEGRC